MNWVQLQNGAFWKKDAEKSLKKIKAERENISKSQNKELKLVKVSDKPLTYKEVFV